MNLIQALGLSETIKGEPPSLAFVGSGGKTTAIFCLARQLLIQDYPAVFVSTTTHFAAEELLLADRVFFIHSSSDWTILESTSPSGIILVSNIIGRDNRAGALQQNEILFLNRLATGWRLPLLIEADGSRRLPLKAPAVHEPVIPSFVNGVIVVAGLSGLNHPLDDHIVHRVERFADLSGLNIGDRITPDSLARVLVHPQGGLRQIPEQASRILLLNQADTNQVMESAYQIADRVQPVYSRVILANLRAQPDEIRALCQPIAGIILAAGGAIRFGQVKQLLSWRGLPLIQHVIQAAQQGGLNPLRVVLGAYADEIRPVLETFSRSWNSHLEIIYNPAWESGLSSSIRAGLKDLPAEVGGAVFMLADQPQVPADLVKALRFTRAERQAWVVAPRFQNRRVNPVLFGRELFDRLLSLQGDVGGRALLQEPSSFPISWVTWDSSGLDLDIDNPADFERLLEFDDR